MEEFEAFVDNLESWFIYHLTEFNKIKKAHVLNAQRELEAVTS